MKSRTVVLVLLASLLFAPLGLADMHTSTSDVEAAEQDREETMLAQEDIARALQGISNQISAIGSSLERCESDVCRSVRANADKRHELVREARSELSSTHSLLEEVRGIVQEDIRSLERCESDVCRRVLAQEQELLVAVNRVIDMDGDGYVESSAGPPETVAHQGRILDNSSPTRGSERGERIDLADGDSLVVSRVAQEDSVVYEVQTARGGGAGKVSLQSFKRVACPNDRCEEPVTIEVVVTNSPPVTATISPDIFADHDMHVAIDESGNVEFGVSDGVCSQRGQSIHCRYGDESAVFSFARGVEVSCAARDGSLWCWGQNRAGEETQVVFTPTQRDSDLGDARREVVSDDCDDADCPVRPGADVTGEIILEEGREMRGDSQRVAAGGKKGYDYYTSRVSTGLGSSDLNDTSRDELGEYLRERSELRGADFGLAVAYAASGNERVRSVRYNNESDRVEVDHVEDVRLFGFIPVRATARSSMSADGEVDTRMPWWAALARKDRSTPIPWMAPESVIDALDLDSDGDGVPTGASGDEVDIVGLGDEKVANGDADQPTEARTGRNPQTGKEIQIAAKTVDKSTPALAQASAHVREDDVVRPIELSLQTGFVGLVEGDGIVCGDLADGTPACVVSSHDDNTLWCWGGNERGMSQDACPDSRADEGIELAVEKIEREHRSSASGPIFVLDARSLDELSFLLVVHTGDVPGSEEAAMNKAELVEAIASEARLSVSGYMQIDGVTGESRAGIPPSINAVEITSAAAVREDGLYLNLQDWDLPSNSLSFVEVAVNEAAHGDDVIRILKKKLSG